MALTEAGATLLSGGVTAGTSIIAGLLNMYSTAVTNRQNRELAADERADTLAAQRANRQLQEQAMAMNTRQQNFNEAETLYQRGRTQEKTNYERARDQYQEAIKLLSTNAGLVQNRTAPFIMK